MSKNKNNQPIWGIRIKKNSSNLFKKVGGSLSIDKRLLMKILKHLLSMWKCYLSRK